MHLAVYSKGHLHSGVSPNAFNSVSSVILSLHELRFIDFDDDSFSPIGAAARSRFSMSQVTRHLRWLAQFVIVAVLTPTWVIIAILSVFVSQKYAIRRTLFTGRRVDPKKRVFIDGQSIPKLYWFNFWFLYFYWNTIEIIVIITLISWCNCFHTFLLHLLYLFISSILLNGFVINNIIHIIINLLFQFFLIMLRKLTYCTVFVTVFLQFHVYFSV